MNTSIESGRSARFASRRSHGDKLWPPPAGGWVAIASVVLLYGAHLAYGALYDAALLLAAISAVFVLAALLQPRMRDDLLRLKGLEWPGALFALVIGVGVLTLTPWTPGGAHPVWSYVGAGSASSTIDRSATIVELVRLMGLACLFLVGCACGARDDRARYAVRLTLAFGVAFGLWAFIASATGAIYQSQGHRLEARFLNPNTAGTFFAVLLLLTLPELRRKLKSERKPDLTALLPLAAAALTFTVCLLASASRGAMLAFLAGAAAYLLVLLATGGLKISRALLGAFGGILSLVLVLGLVGDRLIERAFHTERDAVVRHEIWAAHWQAFLDSPLFGYGLGTAETVNKTLINPSNAEVLWNIKAILNVYIQWLEEAGIVGAAPMFLCIGVLVFITLRGALRRSRMTGLLAALLAVDVVFLAHGLTDFALQVPSMAALWAWLLGLQVSLAQGSSRR
ncbi:O-antigen ligase family protein [Phenylobacterium deserti]|uniref:O-antigen ligase family protein n=1 Tax=Phenylobacterium deserti TaxID=1914756 RepID=A0A328AEL3_9CAUL|nr:O-antigen ligase family protein [Phenylobacterium deserti]RAK52646.1 O-antigen ligase family protein [Phenylobacterium deserti]